MTLQVVEHQKLRIGDGLSKQHWQALITFAARHSERYFTVLHNGIRFSNYVGVLQVGDLTIEILPKVAEATNVQRVLIDMLRECRLLKPESTGTATLRTRNGTLLEIYITQFLNEIEVLLKQGLTRSYAIEAKNGKFLKGKVLLNKQLERNLIHPERFYTRTSEYSYYTPFNQILYSTLLALQKMPLPIKLVDQAQTLIRLFPAMQRWTQPLPDLNALPFNRETLRYKSALEMAWLFLQSISPDIRAGQLSVLAILFDMNFLFESFIFRQLQKAANAKIIIRRQVPKLFWNRRSIQPDILLTSDNQNIVIDTKWKKLQKVSPAMEDLRQMYVYNQYFGARHSVLVYPRVPGLEDLEPVPFHALEDSETYFCEVRLVDLVKDGQLNRLLGLELMQKIGQKSEIGNLF